MHVGVWTSPVTADIGGCFTFEQETLNALTRVHAVSSHRFTVFTRSTSSDRVVESDTLKTVRLSSRGRLTKRLASGFGWARLCGTKDGRRRLRRGPLPNWTEQTLTAHGVDVVWYLTHCGADTCELPFITNVWDLQHRLQPYFPEVSRAREWDRREAESVTALRRATAIITGTHRGKAEIERFYQVAAERIHVLPHPTPRFAFESPGDPASVLERFQLPPNFLLYPAQFWPHKNHVGLLAGLKLLRERHGLKPSLVLVGSDKGNRRVVEERIQEFGLAAQVHLLGFVAQHELAALYRRAFALTYLTYFGPENLPPLEAFAAGCPVIASQVAGSEEQLAGAAMLVDPRDAVAIADAIAELHHHPARRAELIARGRERALRFTPDDYVRGVFSILDEFEPICRCWRAA